MSDNKSIQPLYIFLSIGIVCLFAFWLSIPLPRVDNQLIGSDGVGYYAYLPSLLLDGDLNFTDEYAYFYSYDTEHLANVLKDMTPRGLPKNQWSIGPALLWMPFFLLAHVLALILNLIPGVHILTDGMGYWYQSFVLSGSILYGVFAIILSYDFVRLFVSERSGWTSVVLIATAGNLIYYMTAEPYMSHTTSAFMSAIFFLAWAHLANEQSARKPALLGAIAGGMALVRPQDGLFLLLPFVADIIQGLYQWRKLAEGGLIAAASALVVFSPQLFVWHALYGSFLHSGYSYSGGTFSWTNPKLFKVLFSAYRGLFIWHPVFLLSVIGLIFAYRRNRSVSLACLIGFLIQWYVISSWSNWQQGDAFGGRMFIVCTPIFALGLAHLIEWTVRRWSWSVVYTFGGMLLVWNFLLFLEYRFDLVTAQRPPTWRDLTIRRVTFLREWLGHIWN